MKEVIRIIESNNLQSFCSGFLGNPKYPSTTTITKTETEVCKVYATKTVNDIKTVVAGRFTVTSKVVVTKTTIKALTNTVTSALVTRTVTSVVAGGTITSAVATSTMLGVSTTTVTSVVDTVTGMYTPRDHMHSYLKTN